jgi:hypothetical protein
MKPKIIKFCGFILGLFLALQASMGLVQATPNNTTADRVFGRNGSFTEGRITPNSLDNSRGVEVTGDGVYIADEDNHRVLFYPNNSTTATRVYGQKDSFTVGIPNNGGISATSLNEPRGIAVDSTGVYIADRGNHRVLFYTGTSTTATRVYGQPNFTSDTENNGGVTANSLNAPIGVAVDNTGVYIADHNNHRVLFYTGANTTATRVYGQNGSFTTNQPNLGGATPTANTLNSPRAIALDSTGVYIADENNHRVLFYSGKTDTTADRVYGQNGSFTTGSFNEGGISANSLFSPRGVALDSTGVYISDGNNRRLLFYSGTTDTTADRVYGQNGSFTTDILNIGGSVSANGLNVPTDVAVDDSGIYLADGSNNRVLFYAGKTDPTADRVYGQGGNFTTISITGPVTATTSNFPSHIAVDSTGVYIAENHNHRVLFYPNNSTNPTRVYGQPNFTSDVRNNGGVSATSLDFPNGVAVDNTGVYIVDRNNHRVLFYPGTSTTATRVYGQPNLTSNNGNNGGISANSLFFPMGVAVDNTGVYIADANNNRVLFYTGKTDTTADKVYGQNGNFTTNLPNLGGLVPTANTLRSPSAVAVNDSGVYIADTINNRVLFYTGKTDTTADRVYGQPNFNTNTDNTGGLSATSLSFPFGVSVDSTGVYIADANNNRVLYYVGVATTATTVYGQPNFTSNTANNGGISANSLSDPIGVTTNGVGLYIADNGNSRVLYYSDKDLPPPSGTVKLLPNPVRVASTQAGDGLNSPKLTASGTTPSPNIGASTTEFTIGGTNNIPANATGVFGVLTNVGCTGGANFRFWTGNTVPNAANLNVPGANSALNLSTNFIAPLAGGKVKLGLGSGANVTCGYVMDVSGYITAPAPTADKVTLLANSVRVASTQPADNLNSPKLTASGLIPSPSVGVSTVEFTIGGTNNIPADAKGIIGVLTNVGCSGGGNFRFFTGNTVPNASNLNVPGALSSLNLSTGFMAGLDNGKIKLGLGSGTNITCGYVLDVVGYLNAPAIGGSDLNLLSETVRVNSTLPPQNNQPLTAGGTVPANPSSILEITGANANGIPAGAKGILGVLTNVGCNAGGNFRFWTGATPPNAANLNIPGAFPTLNLSTGFAAGLDDTGKVKMGLGSGQSARCGFVVDVVGFLN